MTRRLAWALVSLAVLASIVVLLHASRREEAQETVRRLRGRKTVADRVAEYGPAARERLVPHFAKAGVTYPPGQVTLVGLKQERRLEVYAGSRPGELRFICDYKVLGASGKLGPKLRYGDMQVPEGLYEVESLNPNSSFHLALRVSYPNEFDRARGAEEGREDLGGDIMIHGDNGSIGCLAMGDEAIEELFVLVAETPNRPVPVILAPVDFRERKLPRGLGLPPWTVGLYHELSEALKALPTSS